MVPRAMWRKAPLALAHRPSVFAAVASAALLAALAAASGPLGRAGIESEALKGKLAALTPLAAGLTIERQGTASTQTAAGLARADNARRGAAVRLARALPSTGTPVLTSSTSAVLGGKAFAGGIPTVVIPMSATGRPGTCNGSQAAVAPRGSPRPSRDEPTSHQDRASAELVWAALTDAAAAGTACLVATHEPDARLRADVSWEIESGRVARD